MKQIAIIFTFMMTLLTVSCDKQKAATTNPLLAEWETPYGIPPFDQIRVEHCRMVLASYFRTYC